MKRLRSSESEDLHSYNDKNNSCKDSNNLNRSFSSAQRSFYYKQDNARKGLVSSSSSRYERDRTVEEDREGSRMVRKRSEHDFEGFDRRKGFDRYRESDRSLIHRSESFCGGGGSRRDQFPKGFRSERERSRREGSVSSWRRGLKDLDDRERVVRSPKGLRDVKSPSWSRDSVSESEQSKKRSSSSPRPFRDGNSIKSKSKSPTPTWSKDSESEQSKSVEVKKAEEESLQQVQSGSGSEMEEGELEPEPQVQTETETVPPATQDLPSVAVEADEKQAQKNECHPNDDDIDTAVDEREEFSNKEEVKPNERVGCCEVKDGEKIKADELADVRDDQADKMLLTETEVGSVGNNGDDHKMEEGLDAAAVCEKETKKGADVEKEKVVSNEEEHKRDKDKNMGVDLGTITEVVKPELNDGVSTGNEVPKQVDREMMMESVVSNAKNKGKGVSVAVAPPTDVAHSSGEGLWLDRGSRDLPTCSVDVIEGPSTRGFELFSRSPVRKVEKVDHSVLNMHKDDMEQLDLTLSLPNVLLPIGAHETGADETTSQAPGSPSQARSVQSLSNTFCTNSDGFTASMSFSGSQSFYHNPSCSLTKNSVDYEQSVGSRPLFGGIDQNSQGCWQGQPQSDPKQKEVPFGQRTSANGNGSLFQSQASWGVLDSQAVKGQHSRVLEGSSKMGSGLDKQLSFHKQSRCHDDVRSPSQSVGSHDIGSNYSFEKKREVRDRGSGSLYRTTSQKEQEQLMMGGVDFVETIIARIVCEPVHAMSRKFHEMTGQSIVCLKEGIREIMLNADKHGQILAFQKVLQNRSDIILDVLLKCHRVQLEILVALKTGLTHFLHLDSSISSSELSQIFLNLRCRNLSCRSQLPVDECDCKVCAQKNGFCRECMCLVCSKFDNASNTCSWVGCDVCLHWCHTDCGLRESYIRNGIGTKGMTEMQFHCIACDHPSEMFGFVKEVFQNFAKEWSGETLCKELEYVKRIFSASKDMRGRQLHEIAEQMLPRLANKSNLPEVLRHIMSFLSDGDSSKLPMTANFSGKEQIKENNGVAGPSQEAAWMKSIYSEKQPLLERPANILPTFDQSDKRTLVQELQMSSIQKDFCFDELESIVKIKQAEAKMFQSRADDARREAEGLKRIALAKNEKIEEEYTNRIAKLRLTETDEIRKQKFEEAQALERAHLEYLNMKMRMETDIKDLLSKMEATKMSLAM